METRKNLSTQGLLSTARTSFAQVKDHRNGDPITIPLVDALMSGLAVFSLKSPSLFQFDQRRVDPVTAKNLGTLYGIEHVPSDTQMRTILDDVDPRMLRTTFKYQFANLQRGKVLVDYQFIDGAYLISLDGTGFFMSDHVHCSNCCERTHRDGRVSYYHQMLSAVVIHPQQRQVIPLCPEPILKYDGSTKNDCERNAAKRFLRDFRLEHPHLRAIIVEDSLASNGPHIQELVALNFGFILGAKSGDHGYLFDAVAAEEKLGNVTWHTVSSGDTTHKFRFINGVPLNESNKDIKVNFLEYWEKSPKKSLHFSWVTSITLSVSNVDKIMRGGRARWKIENETFNTLKNQGYQFEHNFGHGHKNLSTIFAFLMTLAFLIDQAQAHCDKVFQAARDRYHALCVLWDGMRSYFRTMLIPDWVSLWKILALAKTPAVALPIQEINTS